MNPRKSHDGKIPRWLYKSHGAKTRQLLFGPYSCPVCGLQGLLINVDKKSEKVLARCSCGFSKDLTFAPAFEPVDYYGKLIDQYYRSAR